jgi:hypothetical protein
MQAQVRAATPAVMGGLPPASLALRPRPPAALPPVSRVPAFRDKSRSYKSNMEFNDYVRKTFAHNTESARTRTHQHGPNQQQVLHCYITDPKHSADC